MSDQVIDSGTAVSSADSSSLGASTSNVSAVEQSNSVPVSPSGETSPITPSEPNVEASTGETTTATEDGAVSTAAEESQESRLDFDTEALDEKVRNAFIGYRTENKELKQFKQQLEPAYAAIQERGGWENVQRDIQIFESALSEDPNTRAQFHQALFEESPQAYQRFVGDLLADEGVQQSALQSLGLNPELIDLYRQVTQTGALPPGAAPASFDSEWLSQIKPEYRDLLSTLDPEYQADLALRDPKVANADLEMRAKVRSIEQQQQQAARQAEFQQQEQQKQEIETRKNAAYFGIRDVVKTEVSKLFPGDSKLQEILTNSAEAALLKSPKGAQLWSEIEQAIESGEQRAVKMRTPQIVAEALVQVQQELRDFASIHDKARKYDELMRSQQNGRDVPPGVGQSVTQNGKINLPNPNARGQFDPANILALRNQIWGGQ